MPEVCAGDVGTPKKDDGEMVEGHSDYDSDLDIDNVSPSE
jgi:hypothetical protein